MSIYTNISSYIKQYRGRVKRVCNSFIKQRNVITGPRFNNYDDRQHHSKCLAYLYIPLCFN